MPLPATNHHVRQFFTHTAGPKIVPAMLECDYTRLGEVMATAKAAGAGMLHFDVMDGHFVPNLTYGPPVLRSLRKATDLPFEAHLMIDNPGPFIKDYAEAGCDLITIHVEAAADPAPVLTRIREQGALASLALNPETPLSAVERFLDQLDAVLVMGVKPGFGGQSLDPGAFDKLRRLRQQGPAGLILGIDGGMHRQTIPDAVRAGAGYLVVGSGLFRAADFAGEFQVLRNLALTAGQRQS